MSLGDLLGRFAKLKIRRFAGPGAYLALDETDDRDVVLLIGSEIPEGAKVSVAGPWVSVRIIGRRGGTS